MLGFYETQRCTGCNDESSDGDMLLFQWGTYGRDNDRRFELDITRQFMTGSDEDDEIWQLHLTFIYEPGPELAALDHGSRWCHMLRDLPDFGEFVMNHEALRVATNLAPRKVRLLFEGV